IDEEVKNADWYKNTNVSRGHFPVVTRKRSDTGELDTFNVVRELNYYNHNTAQKILNIELNTAFIDHIFNNVTFPGDVYLVNDDGAIEYTTNPDIHWSDRKSTRLNSSHVSISYAVFCLKKKTTIKRILMNNLTC